MLDIGPGKAIVLLIVAVIVVGPERLPALARDAARLLRTLRELSTGVRQQVRDELGPEFADLDLRSLNPRAAAQRWLLEEPEAPARPAARSPHEQNLPNRPAHDPEAT